MADETTVRVERDVLSRLALAAETLGFKLTAQAAVAHALEFFVDLLEGRDSDECLFVHTPVAFYRLMPGERRQANDVSEDHRPKYPKAGPRSLRRTIVAKEAKGAKRPRKGSGPLPDAPEGRYERLPIRPDRPSLDRLRIALKQREEEEGAMGPFELVLRRRRNAVERIMAPRSPTDRQLVNEALDVAFRAVRDELQMKDAPSDEQIAKAIAQLRTGGRD